MILATVTGMDIGIMIFSALLGVAWVIVVHKFLKGDGYDSGRNEPGADDNAGQEPGHSHHGH